MASLGKPETVVVFDFDGVIVSSHRVHLRAWEEACISLGAPGLEPELREEIKGQNGLNIAKILIKKIGLNLSARRLFELKENILAADLSVPPLVPGFMEFEGLLAQEGISYAIASNAKRSFIEKAIIHYELKPALWLGLEDVFRPKPSPEIYLKTAQILGIMPSRHKDIWVFEDSETGAKAGLQAGMKVIGISYEASSDRLKNLGLKLIFADFTQVIEVLTLRP